MNILIIGAHPDDMEMSCGGAVARWISEGHTVYNLVMVKDVPQIDDLTQAEETLGVIPVSWPTIRDLSITSALVAEVEKALSNIRIDRIITHWKEDWHQDHRACYELGNILARKQPIDLWYMSSHPYHLKYREFSPEIYIDISEFMNKKYDAMDSYRDAIGFHWRSGVIHHDAWRGSFIETPGAEVFKLGNLTL